MPANMALATDAGKEEVLNAHLQYYAALNAMFTGDLEPKRKLWSHADGVTYMGPDGSYKIGWQAVLADWEKQAAMKLGGRAEPEDVHVNVGKDVAAVHEITAGQNDTGPDDSPSKFRIRVTNIFREENGEWKMIGHHADPLPFLLK